MPEATLPMAMRLIMVENELLFFEESLDAIKFERSICKIG